VCLKEGVGERLHGDLLRRDELGNVLTGYGEVDV